MKHSKEIFIREYLDEMFGLATMPHSSLAEKAYGIWLRERRQKVQEMLGRMYEFLKPDPAPANGTPTQTGVKR